MRSTVMAGALAATVLLLAGCSSESGAVNAGSDGASYSWGQTHHDEVSIRVSDPTTFTTPERAYPSRARAWKVTITFTNNTKRPFSPVMINTGATVGTVVQQEVYAPNRQCRGMSSMDPVKPGRKGSVTACFTGSGQPKTITFTALDGKSTITFSGDG